MDNPPIVSTRKARSGSQRRQRSLRPSMACTPDERARLNERAERAGMPVSAYMRHQCLGEVGPRAARRPPVERAALSQLLGLLGKAGSNMNQVARALNMGQEPPADVVAAFAAIREAGLAISATLRGKQP